MLKTKLNSLLSLGLIPAVLCAWGFSWPTMKLALHYLPPLWLGTFRLGLGCVILFIVLLISRRKFWPSRQDLPFLLSVGLGQMGVFTMLIILGLSHVEAGRSSILVYTTPLWVTPLAVCLFKESLGKLTLLGLLLGLFGVIWLFNPFSFNWHDHMALVGNGLLVLAAWVWSITILHVRFGKHQSSAIELAPWQMLLGTILVAISACIFEPRPAINWSWSLVGELGYLGPFATAFAYWGILELNRKLPAITISLLLLAVPMIGLFSSFLILKEPITRDIFIAMLFILSGLLCVALTKRQPAEQSLKKS